MRGQVGRWASGAALVVLGALLVLGTPGEARAHGIWGHVHVTGWAIENLPPGALRDFFADPEVRAAALFGAAFTDSGYFPQGDTSDAARAYGEHTHWEPFVERYIQWMLANDPPPFDDLTSRKRVAFLMGCAAHGLQDEIFDSLFLYQVDEHDGAGQSEADPATDGFLALDGHLRFFPTTEPPYDVLLEIYAEVDPAITREIVERGAQTLASTYLTPRTGVAIAEQLGREREALLPWTRDHYLDPDIPGSLRAEITPTTRYLEALWARLHGDWDPDAAAIFAYPEAPRRLRSHDAASPDSWVTFIFGAGVRSDVAPGVWLADDAGEPVAHAGRGTRWGGLGSWGRLVRLQPDADLTPGAWYTTRVAPGLELINGAPLAVAQTHAFQVACDEATADLCPDLGELPVASIDPPDVPEPPADEDDVVEAAGDVAEPDVVEVDGADVDPVDPVDAADAHAPVPDVADQGGAVDDPEASDDGCGCRALRAADGRAPAPLLALAALLLGVLVRGRRP